MSESEFSLQEFCDFIPNCFICNKTMKIKISTKILPYSSKSKNFYFTFNNGLLKSKNESIIIDVFSLVVTDHKNICGTFRSPYFVKLCSTCDNKVSFTAFKENWNSTNFDLTKGLRLQEHRFGYMYGNRSINTIIAFNNREFNRGYVTLNNKILLFPQEFLKKAYLTLTNKNNYARKILSYINFS